MFKVDYRDTTAQIIAIWANPNNKTKQQQKKKKKKKKKI